MTFELTQAFYFEAAHSLQRTIQTESSRRIHGHTYHAEVTLAGTPDPATGMLVDLGYVRQALEELRDALDHRFLDEIADLGPATLENLCAWIARRLQPQLPGLRRVMVERRASGDRCTLTLAG